MNENSPIRLIAVDLDGTLLTSDGILASEGARLLKMAAKNGVHIVLATSRVLDSAGNFCRLLEPAVPSFVQMGLRYMVRLTGQSGLASRSQKKLDWR